MKLTGHTILITGGSAGIGLAFALKFIELGNEVIVTGRRQSKLDEVKRLQPKVHTIQSDVADPAAIAALAAEVKRRFPMVADMGEGDFKVITTEELVRDTFKALKNGALEIRVGQSNQLYWMSRIAPGFINGQLYKGSRALIPTPASNLPEGHQGRSPRLVGRT